MPFLEIFDFDATPEVRKTASKLMTKSLCDAFDIAPEIVSAYFFAIDDASYSHAGEFSYSAEIKRIFVKVHAFRRPVELRRVAAGSLTEALAAAYSVKPKSIVIYFFDREPDEVSHSGILADTQHTI